MSGRQSLNGYLPAVALATALIAGMSTAEASPADDVSGYLTTADGKAVTDSYGDCWHTREWHPGMHFRECDPRLVRSAAVASLPVKGAPKTVEHAEAPVVHPKPSPQPVPFKISTDALFDFDSVALKPEGRAVLDKLETQIAHASYRTIDVTGHTDRIGSPSYNRQLSERRAQAVRDYLAGQGLDVQKISTNGVGSAKPVTGKHQCDGLRGARFIQCLQPDRYAEITVAGTAPEKSAMR